MSIINLPVIELIKSGLLINNGNSVFLSANIMGIKQVKKTEFNEQGCITPSGVYGNTNYSILGIRFRNYGDNLII